MAKFLIVVSLFIINICANAPSVYGADNWNPVLPPEPSMPKVVCTTLKAQLTQTGGLLPDAADATPDTHRLQEALNACPPEEAVKLSADGGKNAFLSSPLTLPSGVKLWVDAGVTLFASRNPREYDKTSSKICGTVGDQSGGCGAFITATNTKNSGIYGDGIIDGRGGSKLSGQNVSWWDNAMQAKNANLKHSAPHIIDTFNGSNFTLYRILLENSPNFHVVPHNMDGFIAWGVKIKTPSAAYPAYNASTAKNTDGIDPSGSSNVVIAYSYIDTGDDNVAIKGGSPSSNIIVMHNHFYRGHGMSIGSETNGGVHNVLVRNLTIDGADNGLRIKSDASCGGLVTNIKYEQVCIQNTDSPLEFNAFYSNKTGQLYPNYQNITVSNVHILSSHKRKLMLVGYNAEYPLKITLDNVVSDILLNSSSVSNVYITQGPGAVTGLQIVASSDKNVKLFGTPGKSTPVDCSHAFVPFPS